MPSLVIGGHFKKKPNKDNLKRGHDQSTKHCGLGTLKRAFTICLTVLEHSSTVRWNRTETCSNRTGSSFLSLGPCLFRFYEGQRKVDSSRIPQEQLGYNKHHIDKVGNHIRRKQSLGAIVVITYKSGEFKKSSEGYLMF